MSRRRADPNVIPKGAKGAARLRPPGDPIKPFLSSRRPAGEGADRWMCYRTEACLAVNDAYAAGKPSEIVDMLYLEYEAAVAALTALRPDIDWYTLEKR